MDLEQIELTIEEAKKKVAMKDAALKLAGNREFKKIFLEGYFEKEAARLVEISGDSRMIDDREEIFDAIKGISHCQQYLRHIVMEGNLAQESIQEHYSMLDEVESDGELS